MRFTQKTALRSRRLAGTGLTMAPTAAVATQAVALQGRPRRPSLPRTLEPFRGRLSRVPLIVALIAVLGGPPPASSAAANGPGPVYHLRIQAIRTADSDGTKASTITADEIATLIDQANGIFADTGVVFEFDPARDLIDVDSTLLNQDCTVPGGADMFDKNKKPPCYKAVHNAARQNYALNFYDGEVVVYFRYGTALRWKDDAQPPQWVIGSAGTGSASSYCASYVRFGAMPENTEDEPEKTHLLAHELGHYFHCGHTFGPTPDTQAQAAKAIRNYIEQPNPDRPKSQGLNAFDGDGLSDTPPDPGPTLFTSVYGHRCSSSSAVVIPVKFSDGSTVEYTSAPDRTNIMSYFGGCAFGPDHFSPQQIQQIRRSIEDLNRRNLIGLDPHARVGELWRAKWTTGWTELMPFALGNKSYHLAYKSGTGEVDIHRIRDDRKGYVKVWEGTFKKGWSSFMPFVIDGSPHFLIYRASDGLVKIARIKGGGQGITILWPGSWDPGFTSIMGFSQSGRNRYIAYNKATGEVDFGQIDTDGTGVEMLWEETWGTGWTSFATYGGGFLPQPNPRFLIYKRSTGDVKVAQVSDLAHGIDELWSDTWSTGWTTITRLSRGFQTYFLLYKSGTGAVKIGRVPTDTPDFIEAYDSTWSKGWTSFERIGTGVNYVLIYKRDVGTVAIEWLCL